MRISTCLALVVAVLGCGGGNPDAPPARTAAGSRSAGAEASQSDEPLKCRPNEPCRPARRVELHVGQDQIAAAEFPEEPYVVGDVLRLLPGDEIAIAARVEGAKLVDVHIAKPGEKAIGIKFWEEKMGEGKYSMMLRVTNPYSKLVRYRLGMQLPDRKSLQATSTCPVLGDGRFTLETWPHPIGMLVLKDFRFVEGAEANCD